jgi:protein-S-isoprenylcysteine O-methyltransferase Ste14
VVAYVLLGAQLLLLVAIFLWHPDPRWVLPGWLRAVARIVGWAGALWLVLGLVGLGRSLSAVPLPVVHGVLKTGGLFRLSRHPIYTGVLALAWGSAVRSAAPGPLVLAGALTVILGVKTRFEEEALRSVYPEYAAYAARTPRFLPTGGLFRGGSTG